MPKPKPKSKSQLRPKSKAAKPAKLSPPKPAKARHLQAGDIFRFHPDCCICGEADQTYEVIRVNEGSATCRPIAKTHTTVISPIDGLVIADFWKSGRPFHISPTASVILLPKS